MNFNLINYLKLSITNYKLLLLIIIIIWLSFGFYNIPNGYIGIIKSFTQSIKIKNEGLKYSLPYPLNTKDVIQETIQINVDSDNLITVDENIILINGSLLFEIKDAIIYNLNTSNSIIINLFKASILKIISETKFQDCLNYRDEIIHKVRDICQSEFDSLNLGIDIANISLEFNIPEKVKPAYDDLINASQDNQKYINNAEAYSNKIIPVARGQAQKNVIDAETYKSSIVLKAEGEANRLNLLFQGYSKSPDMFKKYLYLQTIALLIKNNNVKIMPQSIISI